jgi:hypothetical protein
MKPLVRSGKAALLVVIASTILAPPPARALVNYDQGARVVHGVQLLQDASDPKLYYYVPQFPRLATKDDGSFELLCLKYVDAQGGTNGGLLHALVEFTLPPELLGQVEADLKKTVGDAHVAGPVPLLQSVKDGEEGTGSFEVVSAVLSDRAAGGFTRSLVASGRAPLTPGSKAVVAAILSPQGASLLWNSLSGPTSDVSVSIHGYYEAAVQGYNAKVTADMSTVYQHFSQLTNQQEGYTRRQIRDIVDQLHRDGTLKIEVLDRSNGLGIKTDDLAGILQLVTDKLTTLMFSDSGGWSKDPPREVAVEAGQVKGRQEKGWLARLFTGTGNQEYVSDDQWVLKNRQDIRQNTFTLTLTKNATIRVPVDTSGNLGGLYREFQNDSRYFRIVNLADAAFEFRPVYFQLDGAFLDSFQDLINFVSVNFRKTYPGQPAFTKSIQMSRADIDAGRTAQSIAFPRLGMTSEDWTSYEYQVLWSLRGGPTLSIPAKSGTWIRASDAAVSLTPPFNKRVIEIEADRQLFAAHGVSTAVVDFAVVQAGKPKVVSKATLHAADSAPVSKIAVYVDRDSPIAYRVTWHSPSGSHQDKLQLLESDYLYLVAPAADSARTGGQQ